MAHLFTEVLIISCHTEILKKLCEKKTKAIQLKMFSPEFNLE